MITPLQVKFAKHCALVEVVEHFVYCGYLVTFPDDGLVCPSHVYAQAYFVILFRQYHDWTNPRSRQQAPQSSP